MTGKYRWTGSDSESDDDKGKGKGVKGKSKDAETEQQHFKGKGKGKTTGDGQSGAFQPAKGSIAKGTGTCGGKSGASQPAKEATATATGISGTMATKNRDGQSGASQPAKTDVMAGEVTIATKLWQDGAVCRSLVGRPGAGETYVTWSFHENHPALRAPQYDAQFTMEDNHAMYAFLLDDGLTEDEALRAVSKCLDQVLPRFLLVPTMQLYARTMELCAASWRTSLRITPVTSKEEVMRMVLSHMQATLNEEWSPAIMAYLHTGAHEVDKGSPYVIFTPRHSHVRVRNRAQHQEVDKVCVTGIVTSDWMPHETEFWQPHMVDRAWSVQIKREELITANAMDSKLYDTWLAAPLPQEVEYTACCVTVVSKVLGFVRECVGPCR